MKAPGDAPRKTPDRHADLLVRGGTVITPNGAERIGVACVDIATPPNPPRQGSNDEYDI